MKRLSFGVVVLALAFALPTHAAEYPFTIRGVVDVGVTSKIVHVTATSASSKARVETVGINIGYSISKAKVFKYISGVKKPTSKSQIKLGDEVVMKGSKVGDTFKVDTLVINTRDFEIIGKVKDIDTDLKKITVLVTTSSYRNAGLKGTEIIVHYSNDTICKRLGSSVDCSTIEANSQTAKFKGGVTGTDQVYELSYVWDRYK